MNKEKINIGIIGCGNIGSALARACSREFPEYISGINLWDTDKDKPDALAKELEIAETSESEEALITSSDLIVEAVSPEVAGRLAERAVRDKKDILIVSIGGLLGREDLLERADIEGIRLMLPSGAIAGIDAIKAAKQAGIDSVTLTTRKPPASLKGAEYLIRNGIDIDEIDRETVIFEGSACEAIKVFPKNINVSVLLSIAGIGPENTKVKIITSPDFTGNSHEVVVKGRSGTITARTDNVPSPENPKTSYLAILSVVAAVKDYFKTVRIGS